jgi:hypothetical protein
VTLDLNSLSDGGQIRQASGRLARAAAHSWCRTSALAERAAADDIDLRCELPLDDDFEMRAHAARRLWRALNGKPPGPAFHTLSSQRRQRLALALRALDARMDGNTYRVIAEVLFGKPNVFPSAPGKPTICAIEPFVSCKAASL